MLTGVCLLGACFGTEPGVETGGDASPWFEESAHRAGLDFEHRSGAEGGWWMPEIMAGGAALVDLDGDQWLDAYLVQADGENRLFANLGHGTFADRSAESGADDSGYGMGVAVGDIDNDGDLDLYLTNLGPNVLLRNDGGFRFTDITSEAGVGDPGWGASAAFFDADRDGDQDLMVVNYLRWSRESEIECFNDVGDRDYCSPQAYDAPVPDVFYRNLGDGTFRDESLASGIGTLPGTGLGIVVSDFDGDRWPDVFVANDGMPDRLWMRGDDGTYIDQALLAGCAVDLDGKPKAGMGVTVGDIDDDGDPDLLVCNLDQESDSLFRNQGGFFTDATVQTGLSAVSRPFTRFGMAWKDFDNDGRLDLFQANGRVAQDAPPLAPNPFAEPNLLFRGTESGTFSEVEPRGGTANEWLANSRAAAFGDVDLDGGIDILVVNLDGPAHLLHNVVTGRGHWILLDVREREGSVALGARVTLGAGDRAVVREVRSAFSYQAANDPRVHIGLGPMNEVSNVRVEWIDGEVSEFGVLLADDLYTLRRGEPARRRDSAGD